MRSKIDYSIEKALWRNGVEHIAGIDEAGRGPLAGPVVAAAVVFPHDLWIYGVNDSKMLKPRQREELYDIICEAAVGVGVGIVPHDEIDRINIYQATMKAMHEAVEGLGIVPDHLLVDGPRFTGSTFSHTAIVGGDALCFTIAAASIVAKVRRDRLMIQFHEQYPEYGFAKHKGYGTREHCAALRKYGPSPIHRKSFHVRMEG
ncbi:MAG TPA: ribonuclease HII [Bacteroidota bacterium]|nr:ribonuclease HII [Bacteroidota bacterium]